MIIVTSIYADEMFKWVDEEGILHFTDDPTSIPEKYIDSKLLKREEMTTSSSPKKPGQNNEHTKNSGEDQLYGEQPIYWWKGAFERLKGETRYIEAELRRTRNSIASYDQSKSKIKSKEEISNYEGLKTEIITLEERLGKVREELEELQRKATYHGVPRKIRE